MIPVHLNSTSVWMDAGYKGRKTPSTDPTAHWWNKLKVNHKTYEMGYFDLRSWRNLLLDEWRSLHSAPPEQRAAHLMRGDEVWPQAGSPFISPSLTGVWGESVETVIIFHSLWLPPSMVASNQNERMLLGGPAHGRQMCTWLSHTCHGCIHGYCVVGGLTVPGTASLTSTSCWFGKRISGSDTSWLTKNLKSES